jgi:plastocyanin
MKKWLGMLFIAGMLMIVVAACNQAATTISTAPSNQVLGTPTVESLPNTVHMNNTRFVPDTISIKKGERLTLVNDVAVLHFVANGTWKSNGDSKYKVEKGAPKTGIQFNGNDTHSVGPFNTSGTFHLYCTVHEGMNLTVIVQ